MKLKPLTQTSPIVRRRQGPQRQRGVVLIIALIVLVSMTLAAIGMSRSIDTANLVAGNLAFKQVTLQAGDAGFSTAFTWLANNSSGTTLQNTDATSGYFSSVPVTEPNWFDPNDAIWGNAKKLAGGVADPKTGTITKYVIHRLCTQPDTAYNDSNAGVANQCALTFAGGSATQGASMSVGATQFQGVPQLYYRVTTRVEGPRNTVSIMQMTVQLQV
jgi:type IV pilus assembly protein PilX